MVRTYLMIYKTESSCHETTKVCQSEHANWNAEYCIYHGHNHTPIRLRCYVTISCKKKIILKIVNILWIKNNSEIRIYCEYFVINPNWPISFIRTKSMSLVKCILLQSIAFFPFRCEGPSSSHEVQNWLVWYDTQKKLKPYFTIDVLYGTCVPFFAIQSFIVCSIML